MQTGAVFSGASPTKPWTDVCIAHRTGQRISGPLFFGFSDPLTQRAIAVNLYSQEELQAALQARVPARLPEAGLQSLRGSMPSGCRGSKWVPYWLLLPAGAAAGHPNSMSCLLESPKCILWRSTPASGTLCIPPHPA